MSDPPTPKHDEEVRFLVNISALRVLLIFTPIATTLLFFATMVGSSESLGFHIFVAVSFALPLSGFLIYQVAKGGYLVLDPKRGTLVISGQAIGFDRLQSPRVAEREVEFMSTMWHPTRGTGEGLEIAPGKIILFNSGYSRRKLERIAEVLGEMLEEYEARQAARAARKRGGQG